MLVALALDFTLGDPAWGWHPVRVLGFLIARLEPICRSFPASAKVQGFMFLAMNAVIFVAPVAAIHIACSLLGPVGAVADGVLIYFAIGGTCLAREVGGVADSLANLGVPAGRERLRMLVSRDVGSLDEEGVASSAIESLAENFSDSAVAALFYSALGGPVLAWLHRISNTLDAMVGYKNDEYRDFGYASAKLDDVLNFVPSRASAAITAMVSGDALETLSFARRYGRSLSSPNAGYPIAAFAGALRLRLCGPVSYFGVMRGKPFIGCGPRPRAADIGRAIALYWNAYALSSAVFLLAAWIARA
jgi:adenosylcobinamide-phosphate synthase